MSPVGQATTAGTSATAAGDGTGWWKGDVAIVGGGIVGLATARELLQRRPGERVAVLEKEPQIAEHQSGHNSGVIHSGIYYAPGSMKAKACVAGAAALKRYCDEHGIPYNLCGKVIVATEEAEIPRLENLYQRGLANGVPGIRLIDADELFEIEPHVTGVRALLSPGTGIVDYRQVAAAYAEEIRAAGGQIFTGHEVIAIDRRAEGTRLTTPRGEFQARRVITCAGLWEDRVAALTGAPREPRIVPFRGDYYVLRPERRYLVRGNIYPVPDPAFPFLGVHFTPRMNGDLWLGPNAVLAFARDGYRFGRVNPRDLAELATFTGFLGFARKNWRVGFDEMARDLSKERFLRSLQRYVPEMTLDDLLPGPAGVRAQAMGADGRLVDDFVVDGRDGVLHVRNAPSPAATSSLVIGGLVVDALEQLG